MATPEEQAIQGVIDQIWDTYDVDKSGALDKEETKKFVQDTLGNLGSGDEFSDEAFDEVFATFDKDNSGYLNREEVMEGFQEGATPSAKVSSQRTSGSSSFSDRFEELDWDKNGQVSFREFLFALEKWIGMDEDDVGDETPREKKGSGYFAATSPQQTQMGEGEAEAEEKTPEKEGEAA